MTEKLKKGLNDRQWEACSCTEGPLLILAGAGSGKTRVLTHRISYLIHEKEVDPYNILAITFTNKAANEMRERVDNIIGEGAESIWVSTFHSMCVRILRRFYDRIGGKNSFTIYDTTDQKAVIKEVLRSLNMDPKRFPEKAMIAAISNAKEQFMDPEQYQRAAGSSYYDIQVANVYREYQKRMKNNNALDFDDLIFKTIELFTMDPEVLEMYQNRFRYIMVDEYQDTNHTQFLLVKLLAKKYRNLCVVGDDDQSIYGFRGADIGNILNFEEEYPDAKVVKLEENYRSTQNILNAANAVISNNYGRKDKRLWTENPEGEKVQYTLYAADYLEAEGIVRKILDFSVEGRSNREIAILYRTNAQSRALEEKLIMFNVPYRIYGGTNFYDRKEIKDVRAYLTAIVNPEDDTQLLRIINVPKRGIGNTTISKLQDFAEENGLNLYDVLSESTLVPGASRAKEKLDGFVRLLDEFTEIANSGELTRLFDAILEKTGYKAELQAEGTDEAKGRLENLDEFRNRIASYEQENETPTLTGFLEDIALVADADKGDEAETERVSLMTLHSAKGLEFPIVFIPGMEDGLFPSRMALDSDSETAEEEERRLCYVGITREMELLFMSASESRMMNGVRQYNAESRFVGEIPAHLIERKGKNGGRSRGNGYGFGGGSGYGSGFGGYGGGYGSYGSSYGSETDRKSRDDYQSFRGDLPKDSGSNVIRPAVKKSPVRKSETFSPYQKTDTGKLSYGVGDTVKHIKFGKGVVKEMLPAGPDYEVVVDFEKAGEKRMFASLANLKKC